MDNNLNEIRRKIKFLRAEMLGAEDNIRKQVNRAEDCSEAAMHLMVEDFINRGQRCQHRSDGTTTTRTIRHG